MRNGKKIFGLMFFVIAILSTGVMAQSKIGGIRWQLTELNGKGISNSSIYIEFDESQMRVSGHAGCNRFFGGYERKGQTFKVNGTGSTRMACMRPGLMETESDFLKALNDATRLRRNGHALSIFGGKNRALRFKIAAKDEASATVELGSKKWILKAIGSKPVNLNTGEPFVTFDPERMSVGGNSGCNGFGGNYTANGAALSIGEVVSTMMACEADSRMEIERGLFEGLRSADRFEIKNVRLFLYKGAALLLEFELIRQVPM